MEKALLVTVKLRSETNSWSMDDMAQELEELASSCNVEVVDNIPCVRERPTPNLFIGKGKADEIALLCDELQVDTVIFSRDLSGTHQRNLEDAIGRKTIDRTQLILDIFARHAKSLEGKMQVELAQLEYLLPRLIGKGIILSRLGGGIGTRGPGEQKLEIDRRRLRSRIEKLQSDLRQVSRHRQLARKKRRENTIPAVALVGYTNAGKSTLLNALTGANQHVHDSLFTTLDPVSRSLKLPSSEQVVISDTVGFLHNLPHHLIEAFKATLEEVAEADLLVHVLDASHPRLHEHAAAVTQVLKELGAEKIPLITAVNKIDLLDSEEAVKMIGSHFSNPVAVSAKLERNIQQLVEKIDEFFSWRMTKIELQIPVKRMDLLSWLYKQGKVEDVDYRQNTIKVKVIIQKSFLHKLLVDKEIKIVS